MLNFQEPLPIQSPNFCFLFEKSSKNLGTDEKYLNFLENKLKFFLSYRLQLRLQDHGRQRRHQEVDQGEDSGHRVLRRVAVDGAGQARAQQAKSGLERRQEALHHLRGVLRGLCERQRHHR